MKQALMAFGCILCGIILGILPVLFDYGYWEYYEHKCQNQQKQDTVISWEDSGGKFVLPGSVDISNGLLVKKLVDVYDGDTFRCDLEGDCPDIFVKNISVRILGIDTPEVRGKCPQEEELAKEAGDYLRDILTEAGKVELRDISRDKYFRVLASVWADGQNVSTLLIQEKLAVEYFGETKPSWCE